jgi:hypothetical protein
VFACWQSLERNPWFFAPAIADLAPPPPPPAPGKSPTGPFALEDPARTTDILRSAGFLAVHRTPHKIAVEAPPDSVVDEAQIVFMGVPPGQLAAAQAAVDELFASAVSERERAAAVGEVERAPEGLPRLDATAQAARRGAENSEGAGPLERGRRVLEDRHRLTEQPQAVAVPASDSRRMERDADRSRAAPTVGQLDLFGRDRDGPRAFADRGQREGEARAPGHHRGIEHSPGVGAFAGRAEIRDRPRMIARRGVQPTAGQQQWRGPHAEGVAARRRGKSSWGVPRGGLATAPRSCPPGSSDISRSRSIGTARPAHTRCSQCKLSSEAD